MNQIRRTIGKGLLAVAAAGLMTACGEEPPPTSVSEFMERPILLEATMVRCVGNRTEARTDPECLNAREAVDRIAAREEQARRAELEAQSERKRQALRRAQEAAAEARRRALEEERRREEAELLGPFAPLPEGATEPRPGPAEEVPPAREEPTEEGTTVEPQPAPPSPPAGQVTPTGENDPSPAAAEQPSDLEEIRRELERRQQDPESE